jgi:hypothetical protein
MDFVAIYIGTSPSYPGMDFAKGDVDGALPKGLSLGTETSVVGPNKYGAEGRASKLGGVRMEVGSFLCYEGSVTINIEFMILKI